MRRWDRGTYSDLVKDRAQSASNWAGAIWSCGGDRETLTKTVPLARFGVMLGWARRQRAANAPAVSTFVRAL